MGNVALTDMQARYRALIKKLLPQGKAWAAEPGSLFDQFLNAFSIEPARIEQRGIDFINELDPLQAFETLDRWEKALGIPDVCTPSGTLTTAQRRLRILQKLTIQGGQNTSFFTFIAQQLGYDVTVFSVTPYREFRSGISHAGEAITNGNNWPWSFNVRAPLANQIFFRAGEGAAGDALQVTQNTTLECVIRKFAPAEASVIFSYV